MVNIDWLCSGRLPHHRLKRLPAGKHKMATELLEQFSRPAIAIVRRLDQPLFGRRQHAVEMHKEFVVDQMGVNPPRPTTHVFLLKAGDDVADRRFEFSLRLHGIRPQLCLLGSQPMTFLGKKTGRHRVEIPPAPMPTKASLAQNHTPSLVGFW